MYVWNILVNALVWKEGKLSKRFCMLVCKSSYATTDWGDTSGYNSLQKL